ncbi:hypothetical protein BB561_003774 [Smittium simulii]|uniref:TATA-binding protein interacting (TIP20) domain-containing protein n=1 Tax=Smittium simulii TaxID=133385 RepID=A0A2T9YJJ9_9FUNG|nr:hypothetical protein BB561_003774 [Smittium simulii]
MSTGDISNCLVNLESEDRDFRYMALLELTKIIRNATNLSSFGNIETNIFTALKKSLSDPLAEILNLTINCLATMTTKSNSDTTIYIISQLLKEIFISIDIESKTAYSAAIKKIVIEASKVHDKQENIEKIILPLIIKQINIQTESNILQEALAIIEVIIKASSNKTVYSKNISSSLGSFLFEILISSQPLLWRQATSVLAELAQNVFDQDRIEFVNIICQNITNTCNPELKKRLLKALNGLLQSFQRESQIDYIPLIKTNLSIINGEDAYLNVLALENIQIILQNAQTIDKNLLDSIFLISKTYASFNPSFINHGDDFEETEFDFEDDYIFEQDCSDNEDDSWKIRIASIRLLTGFISYVLCINETCDENNRYALSAIDILISRFNENEDMVRSIVLSSFIEIVQLINLAYYKFPSSTIDDVCNSALEPLISSFLLKNPKKSKETIKIEFNLLQTLIDLSIKYYPDMIGIFFDQVLNGIFQNNFSKEKNTWITSTGFETNILSIISTIFRQNETIILSKEKWVDIINSTIDALCRCFENLNVSFLQVLVEATSNVAKVLSNKSFISLNSLNEMGIVSRIDTLILCTLDCIRRENSAEITTKLIKLHSLLLQLPASTTDADSFNKFLVLVLEKSAQCAEIKSVGAQITCSTLEFSANNELLQNFASYIEIVALINSALNSENYQNQRLNLKALTLCITPSNKPVDVKLEGILDFEKVLNNLEPLFKNSKIDENLICTIGLFEQLILYIPETKILDLIQNIVFCPISLNDKLSTIANNELEILELPYYRFFSTFSKHASTQNISQVYSYLLNLSKDNNEELIDNGFIKFVSVCISGLVVNSSNLLDQVLKNTSNLDEHSLDDIRTLAVYFYISGNLCFDRAKFQVPRQKLLNSFKNPKNSYLDNIFSHSYSNFAFESIVSEAMIYNIGMHMLYDIEFVESVTSMIFKNEENYFGKTSMESICISSLMLATNDIIQIEKTLVYQNSKDLALSIKSGFPIKLILEWIFKKHSSMMIDSDSDVYLSTQLAKILSNIILISNQTSCKFIEELLLENPGSILDLTLTICMRLSLNELLNQGYFKLATNVFNKNIKEIKDPLEFLMSKCLNNISSENCVLAAEALQLMKSYLKALFEANPLCTDSIKLNFIEKSQVNQLEELVQMVFKSTLFKNELVSIEKIGPFQNLIDRGVDSRKLAFEVLEIILLRHPIEVISVQLEYGAESQKKILSIESVIFNGLDDRDHSVVTLASSLCINLCKLLKPVINYGYTQRLLDTFIKESSFDYKFSRVDQIEAIFLNMFKEIASKIVKLFAVKTKPSDSKQFVTCLNNAKKIAAKLTGNLQNYTELTCDFNYSEVNSEMKGIFNSVILIFENNDDPEFYKTYKHTIEML